MNDLYTKLILTVIAGALAHCTKLHPFNDPRLCAVQLAPYKRGLASPSGGIAVVTAPAAE
jgi:hypothetical protein